MSRRHSHDVLYRWRGTKGRYGWKLSKLEGQCDKAEAMVDTWVREGGGCISRILTETLAAVRRSEETTFASLTAALFIGTQTPRPSASHIERSQKILAIAMRHNNTSEVRHSALSYALQIACRGESLPAAYDILRSMTNHRVLPSEGDLAHIVRLYAFFDKREEAMEVLEFMYLAKHTNSWPAAVRMATRSIVKMERTTYAEALDLCQRMAEGGVDLMDTQHHMLLEKATPEGPYEVHRVVRMLVNKGKAVNAEHYAHVVQAMLNEASDSVSAASQARALLTLYESAAAGHHPIAVDSLPRYPLPIRNVAQCAVYLREALKMKGIVVDTAKVSDA